MNEQKITRELELIRALKAGEESALNDFIRRYDSLLSYVIRPIVKDERDIEECLSDIHLKIWKHIQEYSPEKSSFTTWLTVIARNTALNKIRGQSGHETVPLDENINQKSSGKTVEDEVLMRERSGQIAHLIHNLSGKEQELFYRKYYYYQPVEQIAAELGMSLRSVEGKLYRLRKKLQKQWKEAGYDA